MNGSRLWTLGAIVLSLAVLGLGYVLGVAPALASAQAAATTTASVEAQNQIQTNVLNDLREQAESIEETRSELADLQESLPVDPQFHSLLDQIAASAASAGVLVTSVTSADATLFLLVGSAAPAPTPEGETTDSDVGAPVPPVAAPSINGLVAIPITITVRGSGDAIFNFVDSMRLGERLFLMSSVALAPLTEGTFVGYEASVVGQVYVLETSATSTETEPVG
jgi:Tfp pilus assembly protein PilO